MGSREPHGDIARLAGRAQQMLFSGQPAEAAELYGQLLKQVESDGGVGAQQKGDLMRLRGNALREAGDIEASTRSLESAIECLQRAPGVPEQTVVLALALRSVAMNYDALGESAKAATARDQTVRAVEQLLTALPEQAADIIFALSKDLQSSSNPRWTEPVDWLLEKQGRLDGEYALRVLRKLHQYRMERGEPDLARQIVDDALNRIRSLDATTLAKNLAAVHNLAWAAIQSKALNEAEEIVGRMSDIANPADIPSVHAIRRLKALLASARGLDTDVAGQFRDVYEFALQAFGAEDARTRTSEWELADALAKSNQSEEAIKVYRDVLDIERRIGKDQLTVAELAHTLGMELDAASRFAEADEMQRLALAIQIKILGPAHPQTNSSRYEVAEMSRVLDRLEEAEFYFLEALDVEMRLHGAMTEMASRIRNNLGDVYISLGRYSEARELLESALVVRCKLHGDDSERAWRSRMSLAILEGESGNAARSIDLARAAITHDDMQGNAAWNMILAGALLKEGHSLEAEPVYRRLYEAMPVKLIGSDISRSAYFEILEGLATCMVLREDWSRALEILSSLENTVRTQLPVVTRESSEIQLTRFVGRVLNLQSLWLWSLLRAGVDTGANVEAAFELVQLTKGLRTRYLRWRQPGVGNIEQIAPDGRDQPLRELLSEMRRLQDELTGEFLKLENAEAFRQSRKLLAKRARFRELERRLARGISDSETLLDEVPVLSPSLLPEGGTACEIVVVRDVIAERRKSPAANRYVAFVVTHNTGGPVKLIDLGLCGDIDDAVAEMRNSLMSEQWSDDTHPPKWWRLSRFLGKKLLAPWWKSIESAGHLLIAPDGALGAAPFDILGTPDGAYLTDKVKVSYLMRFGELVHHRELFRIGREPLVMAGPDFDLPHAFTGARVAPIGAPDLLARSLGGTTRFEPLPEAFGEGAAVAEILGVQPLLGVWALAPELLGSASPEIIHLSTHGFCLPYAEAESLPSLAAPVGNAVDKRMVLEDPMQRSGLAMSGINAVLNGRSIPPEAGEGMVFASDIQQLNLQRTDLVVLSACRSGLGDVEIGDGAHGLRRAFLAAGCGTVVSTLWDVPDASARKLMTRFYQRLLEKANRLDALIEARQSVRAEYPRDPTQWAGFVLDGYFGPLRRFSVISDLKVAVTSLKDWGITGAADKNNLERLAQRIVEGEKPKPDEVKSVVMLRRVLGQATLDADLRAFVLSRLGDLANRLGDNETAIAHYRSILELGALPPEERVTYGYNLAKILQQMGRLEDAVDAYTSLLTQDPPIGISSRTRVNRGLALGQLRRLDEALSDFAAVINDPNAPPDQQFMAYLNRSASLERMDPAQALSDAEAALSFRLADEVELLKIRVHRSRLLIELGHHKQALDELEELDNYPGISEQLRNIIADLRSRTLRT